VLLKERYARLLIHLKSVMLNDALDPIRAENQVFAVPD